MSLLKHQISRIASTKATLGASLWRKRASVSRWLRDEARNRRLDGLRHHKRKKSIPFETRKALGNPVWPQSKTEQQTRSSVPSYLNRLG